MPERIEVRQPEADQRLDKLLRQRFPNLSFGDAQKLIRKGRVRVNGKRAKAADRIALGALVTLPFQGEGSTERFPAGQALAALTVFDDGSLMAINKPAGLAVQGGSTVKTHVAQMLAGTDLRLVHRLDRDTSGLLLLAHGALAARNMTRAFAAQEVKKTYLAVVPACETDQGRLTLPLVKWVQGGEGRMHIAAPDQPRALAAETDFRVLDRGAGGVLLQLNPRTGRTHQLRVHCAHLCGGIFGDRKYGEAGGRADALLLHAWQVCLPHPEGGRVLNLAAPPPPHFVAALDRLKLIPAATQNDSCSLV